MPSRSNRSNRKSKGSMSTRQAGEMGGQKVRRLVEEGKELEQNG